MWCIRSGYFDEYRKMFNTVKSEHSVKILENLKSRFECGWSDEEKDMVYALEDDMKKW
jgi:hypothetical protein